MALGLLSAYSSSESSENEEDNSPVQFIAKSSRTGNFSSVDNKCNVPKTYNDEYINQSLSLKRKFSTESKDEEDDSSPTEIKRLPMPKLPDYEVNRAIQRTPIGESQHSNRIRSFAHEPGNWATYVYLPIDCPEDFLEKIESLKNSLQQFDFETVDDFHISVTRTVVLRHHWISSFVDSVKASLTNQSSFYLKLTKPKVYINDNKTRTFIGVEVTYGHDVLKDITEKIDLCLKEYNLEPFYKNPSFHMSILSCVGNHQEAVNTILNEMNISTKLHLPAVINHFVLRSGNKSFNFSFQELNSTIITY